jgi:Putative peptidoglycan binding domain
MLMQRHLTSGLERVTKSLPPHVLSSPRRRDILWPRFAPDFFKGSLAGLVLVMFVASPLRAADPALEDFKAEIDAVISGLAPATNGSLEWVGADGLEVRREGDSLVAVITGAKLTLHADEVVPIALDRVEIKQTTVQDGRNSTDLVVLLPKQTIFAEAVGTETKLTLEDGRVNALFDAKSGCIRAMEVAVAGARVDQPTTGAWISSGPLAITSKLVAKPDGRWNAPTKLELKKVEFYFPQAAAGGTIDRIAFDGISAGPKMDEFERWRDMLAALQREKEAPPDARLARLLEVLPTMPSVFGTTVLEGLDLRAKAGEPLVLLTKAEFIAGASGFDGDMAAIRFTIREDGLKLASPLVDARLVPHHVIIDFGVESLDTAALSTLFRGTISTAGGNKGEQQQATQQMLAPLARLNPVSRIYEIAIDTQDVGAELTAEARGTLLSSTGYTADGEFVVRGWDALPNLALGTPFIEYLPFVKEFAEAFSAPDGSPRLKFHIGSAPPKWVTVNGQDVSSWFEESEPSPGQPRLLKPAEPPMQGPDVTDVQRALVAAKVPAEQDGVYRVSTATAVARFQKQKGMNVSGVVDTPTRQALGLRAPARRPAGRN